MLAIAVLTSSCDRDGQETGQTHKEHEDHGAYGDNEESHVEPIHLSEETQRAVKLVMASAEVKPLERTLEVTGQVAQDSDRFIHVHSAQAGIVTDISVAVGARVKAGSVLATIEAKDPVGVFAVMAPTPGLVIGIHATKGTSVDTLTSLMTVADLSQVWATFDFYEQDAGAVDIGQRLDVRSVAYADRVFSGKIIFVSPQVDQHTRMIKVRAQVENPDYALKLGMFVTGLLYVPVAEESLVVPQSAIQRIHAFPVTQVGSVLAPFLHF